MKLVLSNNHTEKFLAYYRELQASNPGLFDYSMYKDLLFVFDGPAEQPITVYNQATSKAIGEYDGVYMKTYIKSYELAATLAICCKALNIPFIDHELAGAPSLSKLSAYAKLAAARVRTPQTFAGTSYALLRAGSKLPDDFFPAVLKRADADRGVDNYKVTDYQDVSELLHNHEDRSIWLLQKYIDNQGFYRVTFYGDQPAFCIFRSLPAEQGGDAHKAHNFRPRGGSNATLVDLADAPAEMIATCQQAAQALDRQIAGVDCIFDPQAKKAYVLEVNNNPQLVTIETFKEIRAKAFTENLKKDWH